MQKTGGGSPCVAETKHKCSPRKRNKCGLWEVWRQPEADQVQSVKRIFLLSSELQFQLIHVPFASVSSYASTTFDMWTSYTTLELLVSPICGELHRSCSSGELPLSTHGGWGVDANSGSGAEPPTGLIGRISQSMTLEFRKCSDSLSDTLSLLCCFVFGGLMGACGGCCFVLLCADVSTLCFVCYTCSLSRNCFATLAYRLQHCCCARLARTCSHEEVE